MSNENQPRNRYGVRVELVSGKSYTYWYPTALARDDMIKGLHGKRNIKDYEIVGAGK